jgi:hypothetical protein
MLKWLPDEILLEIFNFLPVEKIMKNRLFPRHRALRTAISDVHSESDLREARTFPRSTYSLFVYDVNMYYHLEVEDYPKVTKLFTSLYIPPFFQNLRYLNVSHTFIRKLPSELVHLKELVCSHTPIRVLPESYTDLVFLDAYHTMIQVIPEEYHNLKVLRIGSTRVIELPPTFENLAELDIRESSIATLPHTYKRLEKLNARLSFLIAIPEEYTRLRWLDCSLNYTYIPSVIRELPFRYFKEKFFI